MLSYIPDYLWNLIQRILLYKNHINVNPPPLNLYTPFTHTQQVNDKNKNTARALKALIIQEE